MEPVGNLSDAPELMQLPTDRPRSSVQCYCADRVLLLLSAELTEQLRELAQHESVSLFVTLLSGWVLLLGRWSGQEDVVIGAQVADRQQSETDVMIGSFENLTALRIRLQEDWTIEQLLKQANAMLVQVCAHQDVPFEQLTEVLATPTGHRPILQVVLGLNMTSAIIGSAKKEIFGLKIDRISIENTRTPFELSLLLTEGQGGGLRGTLEYASDLFERGTAEWLIACWTVLLEKMVADIQQPISQLSMLKVGEHDHVLRRFNDTAAPYPHDRLVHELFEDQVARTPDAVAVMHEGHSLTYAKLNARANQLARYLRKKGVRPDRLVAICVERSVEMVIGVLGILKAGGAYVPLDPSYPEERLRSMLEDAAPQVMLTQEKVRTLLPATNIEVISLDRRWKEIGGYHKNNLPASGLRLSAQNLVYVIFTSGSTGRPKGTGMPHRSMVNLIEWHRTTFPNTEGQRVLQFAALSFDVAFQETFSTLCTGGTLVLLNEWMRRDARALSEFLSNRSIQRLFLPPLMLQSLAEAFKTTAIAPKSLQDVITAGEQLRISTEISCLFKHLGGCHLHNHYGPTETHVVTALTLIGDPTEWPVLPTIGRPIANAQIHVLDEQRQPVPIGIAGEIYIGGAGVARGYLRQPELTAERFITTDREGRLYKTGDLGRWRADGTIEYLGRNDDQVKIRGFRIELGEIEAHLARHELVKDVAVIAREDAPGQKRLVAYLTQRQEYAPSVEELRAYLKTVLPDYMVPSAFVIMESLPLTPNGKLDRRALPAPELGAHTSQRYEAPRGEVEEILAAIWQELLRVERVGRRDNFFELGGHSLLIVQMMERLNRAGLSAEVHHVFESPTLTAVARTLTSAAVGRFDVPPNLIPLGCEAISPQMLPLIELEPQQIACIVQSIPGGAGNIQDIYPLAPLQEGILFHHMLNEQGGDTYARSILLSLSTREVLEKLIEALQDVIERHDILRTSVLWEQLPHPVQVVYRHATLPVEDLVLDKDRDPIEQLKERMRPGHQRLDLRQAPLMRLKIAADPQGAPLYALLQTHHFVFDNESLHTMFAEVMAYLGGRAQELPEPGAYRNHVAQAMAHARTHDVEAFFRAKLGDIEETTAPFGLLDVHGDGSRLEDARQVLEPALAKRIRAQARYSGVSPATLFHAAWGLVVSRTSGRDDVVYGTVLLGRMHGDVGAQRVLGMFINTLPLRLRLQGVSTAELVEQTQRELADLLNYEQASLAVAQRCSGIGGSTPLFSTLLNYQHSLVNLESGFARDAGVTFLASQGGTNYPITFSVVDQGEGFVLGMETDQRIDQHRVLEHIFTAIQSLVEALEKAPQTPALALSVLSKSEQYQVVKFFNATQSAYPEGKLIHELFEEQVERTPTAVAVVHEGQSLTYAELNGRANKLARYLRGKGIGPDRLVALCVERSVEMLVALFGVLKAGGAYMPIDPTNPTERMEHVLNDAGPQVLLTQAVLKDILPPTSAETIVLDSKWQEIANQCEANLDPRLLHLSSRHLAYVIYTSGSTGKPKGVMVEHRNIVNYAVHALRQFDVPSGSGSLICTSISFDLMLTGLYPPLLCGRTVWLCSEQRGLPTLSEEVIRRSNLAPLKLTPSHLALLDHSLRSGQLANRVRVLVLGGEPLQASTVQLWRKHAPGTRIFNHYGPTETTVGCVVNEIGEQISGAVPIGRPIANTQIYILGPHLQPVPIGVVGEIYIGGAGVARGYLNRPELTADFFILDPFSQDPQARLYRSGDLGRWRADGTIEFLGRNDQQVKIRGFRVELGEIEAQLAQHAQTKEAVVITRENAPGEKYLVAYVTQRNQIAPSVEDLRAHLKAVLPEYMVPSAFVILESLPLTPNGKLDRRALPAPEWGAYASKLYETPQGEIEETVSRIWQKLLRIERIGRQDNFFELGGHSLLAIRVITHISHVLDVDLPLRILFEKPTIAALSDCILREIAAEVSTEEL